MSGVGGASPAMPWRPPPAPVWSVVAPVVGVLSLLSVFVRFPGGLAGVAGGVVGIGAGVAGVVAARRTAARTVPAWSGIVVSALAIGVGVVLASAHPIAARTAGGPPAGETTAAVLRNELEVTVGEFRGEPAGARGRLPVTFRNKTDRAAEFEIAVAAFDDDGTQIDSDTARVALAGRSSEDREMFRLGAANRLATASFRILGAHRIPRRHG